MSIDFTKPIQLKKPAKHGDRVTFEDYSGNLALIEQYLNAYIKSGIKVFDAEKFIDFFKLQIQDAPGVDADSAIIPTVGKVLELFNNLFELRSSIRTKYESNQDFGDLLPTSEVLNGLYTSAGIEVTEISSGDTVVIKSNPTVNTNERVAELNDGILFVVPKTGRHEAAIFTSTGWTIDVTKDSTEKTLIDLQTQITTLDSSKAPATVILASGEENLDTAVKMLDNLVGSKASEASVASRFASVNTQITTVDNKIAPLDGKVNSIQVEIGTASAKATDASSKVAQLEPRVLSVEGQVQTNHNDLVSVNTQITNIKQDITDLETNLDDITLDMSDLEIDIQTNTTSINIINNEVSQIQQKDIAQDGRLDGHDTKNNAQDVKIANLETQLNALSVNPLSKFRAASRKWKGVANGNATNANANTTTIAMSTLLADDGEHFVFGDDDDMSVWLEATATGLGTFKIPADMVIGTTVPDLLEAVRAATGSTLEILSATLGTNGDLTVTRNAGSAIDFTSIKLTRVKQDVLALDMAASSTDLADVGAKVALAQTKANQAYDKAVAVENSLADKQNKAISIAGITATTVETVLTEIAGKTTSNKGLIDGLTTSVAGKQATLTTAQLAVVNGVAVSSADKTKYDGYAATINGKQDQNLSSAVTGFTATTVEGALGDLKTQANTNAGNISAEVTNRTNADAATLQAAKDYADGKITALGVNTNAENSGTILIGQGTAAGDVFNANIIIGKGASSMVGNPPGDGIAIGTNTVASSNHIQIVAGEARLEVDKNDGLSVNGKPVGGGGAEWKDITSTYSSRSWKIYDFNTNLPGEDMGKDVFIEVDVVVSADFTKQDKFLCKIFKDIGGNDVIQSIPSGDFGYHGSGIKLSTFIASLGQMNGHVDTVENQIKTEGFGFSGVEATIKKVFIKE